MSYSSVIPIAPGAIVSVMIGLIVRWHFVSSIKLSILSMLAVCADRFLYQRALGGSLNFSSQNQLLSPGILYTTSICSCNLTFVRQLTGRTSFTKAILLGGYSRSKTWDAGNLDCIMAELLNC